MNIGSTGKFNISDISELGPSNGLVGWWPFNEDASDFGTGRNNGTAVNATLTSGYEGQSAYDISGTSSYIDLGSNILFKDGGGWTVSSWVNFNTVPGSYNDDTSPGNFIGASTISYNSWYWSVLTSKLALWNRNPGVWKYGSTILQPNTWYNAVLTCSYDGTSYQMYLNGVPEGGDHVTYSWNPDFASLLVRYFGVGNAPSTRRIDGRLASTRIYNRPLTPEEVNVLYRITEPNGSKMIQTKDTLYVKGQFLEI